MSLFDRLIADRQLNAVLGQQSDDFAYEAVASQFLVEPPPRFVLPNECDVLLRVIHFRQRILVA